MSIALLERRIEIMYVVNGKIIKNVRKNDYFLFNSFFVIICESQHYVIPLHRPKAKFLKISQKNMLELKVPIISISNHLLLSKMRHSVSLFFDSFAGKKKFGV